MLLPWFIDELLEFARWIRRVLSPGCNALGKSQKTSVFPAKAGSSPLFGAPIDRRLRLLAPTLDYTVIGQEKERIRLVMLRSQPKHLSRLPIELANTTMGRSIAAALDDWRRFGPVFANPSARLFTELLRRSEKSPRACPATQPPYPGGDPESRFRISGLLARISFYSAVGSSKPARSA